MKAPQIANLTPLRGMAALMTLLFHSNLYFGLLANPKMTGFFFKGYLMVDFFFILSGFIMVHVYAQLFEKETTMPNVRSFLVSRLARIYPLHIFTLGIVVIVYYIIMDKNAMPDIPLVKGAYPNGSLLANLLLVNSWHLFEFHTWNHPAWSISVEWALYLLFPFIIRPLLRLPKMGQYVGIALVFVGYYLLTVLRAKTPMPFGMGAALPSLDLSYDYGVLRGLVGFILGIFTYQIYQSQEGKSWWGKSWVFLIAFLLSALTMTLFLSDALIVAFFPILILSAAHNTTKLTSFLNTTVMQKLGDWSYSIYLLQYPILAIYLTYIWINHPEKGSHLAILEGYPPTTYLATWTSTFVWIGATIALSALTYNYIEVPARRWVNQKFK